MTTTPNTTASGAADLAPEIECDCLVAWNRTSKAAPAPQLAPMPYPTDAQIDAVYEQTMSQHLRSQDAPAVRRFGRAMFLCAWNAAAPKAAPAINKVSDIIDAYGMTPGQPERVADIPGLAEALEAAFADGSAQVTGALQQGEYLPLPDADTHCYDEDTGKDVWSHSGAQMHAYVDADRAARGAAQAEPAPVAEDAEIRKALDDAATSLETIGRIAGRDQYMLGMMDVRLYAASRAKVAREALAAQPEGGNHG